MMWSGAGSSALLRQRIRRQSIFTVAIVLFGLVAVPVAQGALDLRRGGSVSALDIFVTPPRREAIRAFEQKLEDRSFLSTWVRPRVSLIWDTVVRRGNRKVLFGEGDWLFYRNALNHIVGAPVPSDHSSKDVILWLRDALEKKGIDLVVVVLPGKASVYPQSVAGNGATDDVPRNLGFDAWSADLASHGVIVIDPTDALIDAKRKGNKVFLKRDTHWTPSGMRVVANLVGDEVRSLMPVSDVTSFTERELRFAGRGDLSGMLNYATGAAELEHPVMDVVVHQVVGREGGPSPVGAIGAEVVILGDSFSLVFSDPALGLGRHGGFAEHVAKAIGAPVDLVAMPGGDPIAPLRALSRNGARLAGAKVVVWQMSERALTEATWQRVDIDFSRPVTDTEEPKTSKRVVAQLDAVSEVPEVFNYPNCLMMTRYRVLEPASDAQETIFVGHWGWRDEKRVAGALTLGEISTMNLEPLSRHHNLERSCMMDTVASKGELWWATSSAPAPNRR